MREETKKKRTSFNYQLFYRRTALIVYDIISVVASSFLALLIRYDFEVDTVPAEFLLPIRQFLWINILLTLLIFYFFRLYHSLWAFAGETELQNLVMACLCASVMTGVGINFFKLSSQAVPDSYYEGALALGATPERASWRSRPSEPPRRCRGTSRMPGSMRSTTTLSVR